MSPETHPFRLSCLIFICAAALRLTLVFGFDHYQIGRPEPIRIAISLAEHGTFADPYAIPTGPTAHSPPLYPAMIAPLYRIWGNTLRADFARFVLNTIAASVEYALLPWVAMALGLGVWPGILAGFGGALLPLHGWAECVGDFEATWVALFLEIATICFARFLSQPRFDLKSAIGWGTFWGAGFLLSPVLLPVLIGFAAIAVWKLCPSFASSARWATGFAVATAVILTPWTIRNYTQLHGVFFVRDNIGLELFVSNHDDATPHSDDNFARDYFRAEHPHMSITASRELIRIGEVPFHQRKFAQGIQWIRGHPSAFLSLSAARIIEFWFPSVPKYRWLIWTAVILGFLGLIAMARSRSLAALILAAAMAGYSAIYSVVANTMRYEHPLWWIQVLAIGWLTYSVAQFCWARLEAYLPMEQWETQS